MDPRPGSIETGRLLVRRFSSDDGRGLRSLAEDKERSEGARFDHPWPTTEEGCQAMAVWCAEQEGCFAACLRGDGRLVGFIHLGDVDEDGRRELGHMFHTEYRDDGYASEAMRPVLDGAFADPQVLVITAHDAVEWPGQLTPLLELGFRETGRGETSIATEEPRRTLRFVASTMELRGDEWTVGGGPTSAR